MAKFWPSLNAHHSATTLVVCPIDLENPLTQSPWQSLITPPPSAFPRFLHDAPSVLNLCQPPNGLIHLTGIANLKETCGFYSHKKNTVGEKKVFHPLY